MQRYGKKAKVKMDVFNTSKTKKIFIVTIILITLISASLFLLLRREPKPTSAPPPGEFLFSDAYEDNPSITKTTHDLWTQVISDTKKGDYWSDEEHWLESAISAEKSYKIDPEKGNARITGDVVHSGTRGVEMEVSAVPAGYTYASSYLARYIRNQSKIVDAVYEIGVWYYVPTGETPILVFGMENHPSWINQYFAYAGIIAENGTVFAMNDNKMVTIGSVDFQYGTWFNLWITWDTRKGNFTLSYESPVEAKTFEVNWTWASGFNIAYIGYKAFNFYAGAGNIKSESQKYYIDDFYAKVIG